MQDYIEARWRSEVEELEELAAKTGGKLVVNEIPDGLRLRLRCKSPVRPRGAAGSGEPEVRDVVHDLAILRTPDWPAVPVVVLHLEPATLVHPNVLHPGPDDPTLPGAPFGLVCYQSRGSCGRRLTDVVSTLHALLGFRYGKWSRDASDCLSPSAVRWANRLVERDPGAFPTERSPLVECLSGDGEQRG